MGWSGGHRRLKPGGTGGTRYLRRQAWSSGTPEGLERDSIQGSIGRQVDVPLGGHVASLSPEGWPGRWRHMTAIL